MYSYWERDRNVSNKKIPQSPWRLRYVQKKYDVWPWVSGASSPLVPCPWYPLSWGQHFVPASPVPAGAALRNHPSVWPVLSLNSRKHPAKSSRPGCFYRVSISSASSWVVLYCLPYRQHFLKISCVFLLLKTKRACCNPHLL